MNRLAFSGDGRYTDFNKGYDLYRDRCRKNIPVDKSVYSSIIKDYCKYLSGKLEEEGMVDLPKGTGTLFAATFKRKPQYRGNKFVGYGCIDWKSGTYDGSNTAFGVTFLPSRNRTANLRCFGFVANRRLFQRLKKAYTEQTCNWATMTFNENII